MTDAAILMAPESNRFPKKSGMVFDDKCWVMTRVLRPSTLQAKSEPIKALPKPIQVEAKPKFQPNCRRESCTTEYRSLSNRKEYSGR